MDFLVAEAAVLDSQKERLKSRDVPTFTPPGSLRESRPEECFAPIIKHDFSRFMENPAYRLLADAASRIGLSFKVSKSNLVSIGHPYGAFFLPDTTSPFTSAAAHYACRNKKYAKKILERAGISVPKGSVFNNNQKKAAWNWARSIGFPLVVKPTSEAEGRGVLTNISDRKTFNDAWEMASRFSAQQIIVEEMIRGDDHRIMVIGGRFAAATIRRPSEVIGDGKSTIAQLVDLKNQERKLLPNLTTKPPITFTVPILKHLRDQGLDQHSIPKEGQRVQLSLIANVTAGGFHIDVTERVHPDFRRVAERVASVLPRLGHVGVDIIAQDITASPDSQKWAVIEANAAPSLPHHHFPVVGQCRDVVGRLLRFSVEDYKGRLEDLRRPDTGVARRVEPRDASLVDTGKLSLERFLVVRAARERGITPLDSAGKLWRLKKDETVQYWYRNMPESTSWPAFKITSARHQVKLLLKAAGIRTPEGRTFFRSGTEAAWSFARKLRGPVAVKPAWTKAGKGIVANAKDKASFEEAFAMAGSARSGVLGGRNRIVVERHVEGGDYRLLVIGGRFVAAVRRWPAHVIGDGQRSVSELIDQKNACRALNPYLRKHPVQVSEDLLRDQGVTLSTVLAPGERLRLQPGSDVALGGEIEDVTELVHPAFRRIAERVWATFPGLAYCGVDLVAQDITAAPKSQVWAALEVDANPGLAMHHFPWAGPGRDVAGALVDGVFPKAEATAAVAPPTDALRVSAMSGPSAAKAAEVLMRPLEGQGKEQASGSLGAVPSPIVPSAAAVSVLEPVSPEAEEEEDAQGADDRSADEQGADDREISAYVHDLRYEDIPASVIERTKVLLLDALGTSVLGAGHPSAVPYIRLAQEMGGGHQSTVIGTDVRCSSHIAGFANAAFAQIHDFNDGHRVAAATGGAAHPGRVVIPTALAEGERLACSGRELLAAIVAGYDVACKIRGRKVKPKSGFYAAAAIAARLQGRSAAEISTAMGLAGYASPSRSGTRKPAGALDPYSKGLCARVGIEAAFEAGAGQKGPRIQDEPELSPRFVERGLGRVFEIMNIYLKPYPTCRMTHSAIEALLRLRKEMNFGAEDVAKIAVRQLPAGMYVARKRPDPDMPYKKAEFNLFYCLSRAVIDGELTVRQFEADCIKDPRVKEISDKIEITSDRILGRHYPAKARPAAVTVTLKDGRTGSLKVNLAKGDPTTFFSQEEIIARFLANTSGILGKEAAEKVIAIVGRMETVEDIRDLTTHLRKSG